MKWKKTSSEKIVAVVTAKIANPDASLRDITKLTDVNPETVSDILEDEMPWLLTSSDKKNVLFETNVEIINTGAEKVLLAMQTMTPEKISEAKDMQSIVETAFKQNQLLTGGKTDNIGIEVVSEEDKKKLLSLLGK